jgi:hypothetical protein
MRWTAKVLFALGSLGPGVSACAAAERPFPLRAPLWQDTDLQSVTVPCRRDPTPKDQNHLACSPRPYETPLIWDGVDNLVFRPLADALSFPTAHEAVNVNSLDEVPDSAWFANRLGARPLSAEEIERGGCEPSQLLDPDAFAEGSWIVDKGKAAGSAPGFRVNIPGKGKYLFKGEEPDDFHEHPSAAGVVGIAAYHAVGFNTSCEQIVYFRPALLTLTPGLRSRANFGDEKPFGRAELQRILGNCAHRDGKIRMIASAWVPGQIIGAARYEGTRSDDPNDVIPHEDRRELRSARLVAAWLDRFDAREGNTLDSWVADDPKGPPDASPGHVVHYQLDTSETLGSEWAWETISRRLGFSYVVDWGEMAADFVTLGIPVRPWDRVRRAPGREMFAYFNVEDFVPEEWKNEYPNAAFSRMTERDGAWMARILAQFTRVQVRALAEAARFSDPSNTEYLAAVLEGRLERILQRYLTRLSSIAQLTVEGGDRLCGVDLAVERGIGEANVRFSARLAGGAALGVEYGEGGRICVGLPRVGREGDADDAPSRYARVIVKDGISRGPLVAHLYDLGEARGYRLVGVERPEE